MLVQSLFENFIDRHKQLCFIKGNIVYTFATVKGKSEIRYSTNGTWIVSKHLCMSPANLIRSKYSKNSGDTMPGVRP